MLYIFMREEITGGEIVFHFGHRLIM